MPITRRWDPCLWRDPMDGWHMLCLAADYTRTENKSLWWMGANQLERWSGPSVGRMEPIVAYPREENVWTAPTVCRAADGSHYVVLGAQRDGKVPDQRIWLADPYTLDPISDLPGPLRQYGGDQGRQAWRDGHIQHTGDGYLLTVTTGGFRWGCAPNVIGWRAETLDGPWWCAGPLVDPAIAVLFGELERPQVFRLQDGRWALIFSCWSVRQFARANPPPVHVLTSRGDEPLFSRNSGVINGPYGLHYSAGVWAGWEWSNYATRASGIKILADADGIDAMVARIEGMAGEELED